MSGEDLKGLACRSGRLLKSLTCNSSVLDFRTSQTKNLSLIINITRFPSKYHDKNKVKENNQT